MADGITAATNCAVWAQRDENKVEEPDGTIPVVNLPPLADYDGVFEGGDVLSTYETEAASLADLHDDWREVALVWSRRLDELLAQVYVLDRVLQEPGTAAPIDEFEDFTSATFGFYAITAFATVQAGHATLKLFREAYAAKKAGNAAQAASILDAAPAKAGAGSAAKVTGVAAKPGMVHATTQTVKQGASAAKPFKSKGHMKGAGKYFFAASTLASIAVIVIDVINRKQSMIEVIPKFHEWMYGRDADGALIATPVVPSDEDVFNPDVAIPLGGTAGRVLEMRRSVHQMQAAIRSVALLAGVPIEEGGEPRDLTLVFCETRQAMEERVLNASQITAANDVATRMLCIDRWTSGVTYTDSQISDVTGVPVGDVGDLRLLVQADPVARCPGIAP